jgi:hypothetical protein
MRRRFMVKKVVTPAMPQTCRFVLRGPSPEGDGARAPRRPRVQVPPLLALLAVLAAPIAACTNGSASQVTQPVALGMTSGMTASVDDGQTKLYQVQVPVPLPVRAMTSADVRSAGATPQGTAYPRGVFLRAEDESVEVRFTISNIDGMPHNVWLLIDPWNEFVRWRPGVTVTEEATIPNFGYDLYFAVPGMQRIEGTITADDMHEIAIKLASVEKLLASPQAQPAASMTTASTFNATSITNNIFNPQNRSNSVPSDPLYTPWIPPVIAGVTGFDLGLRTSEPANVAVEITMDVQDLRGDRFVPQDTTPAAGMMKPPAKILSPPSAR